MPPALFIRNKAALLYHTEFMIGRVSFLRTNWDSKCKQLVKTHVCSPTLSMLLIVQFNSISLRVHESPFFKEYFFLF